MLAFAYLFLFWLLFILNLFFLSFDVAKVLPETKGPSVLGLMRASNALLVAHVGLGIVRAGGYPPARRRVCRACCFVAGGLLVTMQLNLSMLSDLRWHWYHSFHADDRELAHAERIEHYTRAIECFPGKMSEDEYLGRAHAYRLAGDHARAVTGYDEYFRCVEESPWEDTGEPDAFCGRAMSLLELGERERAGEDSAEALRILEIEGEDAASSPQSGSDIVATLLRHLDESDWTLVDLGGTEIVTGLMSLLETERAEAAALPLGKLGDTRAVPALLKAFDSAWGRDPRLVSAVAQALGDIGDRRATGALIRTLTGCPSDWARERAAMALESVGDEAAVPALLAALDRDSDDDTRAAAAYALYGISGGKLPVAVHSSYGYAHVSYVKQDDGRIGLRVFYGRTIVTEEEVRAWAVDYLQKNPRAAGKYNRLLVPTGAFGDAPEDETESW
jgi:tetratricopeptide (TPR) repeat protein